MAEEGSTQRLGLMLGRIAIRRRRHHIETQVDVRYFSVDEVFVTRAEATQSMTYGSLHRVCGQRASAACDRSTTRRGCRHTGR